MQTVHLVIYDNKNDHWKIILTSINSIILFGQQSFICNSYSEAKTLAFNLNQ